MSKGYGTTSSVPASPYPDFYRENVFAYDSASDTDSLRGSSSTFTRYSQRLKEIWREKYPGLKAWVIENKLALGLGVAIFLTIISISLSLRSSSHDDTTDETKVDISLTQSPSVEPLISPTAFTFMLTSSAFADGGELPSNFTCVGGKNLSPPLLWSNAPDDTQDFYLTITEDLEGDDDEIKYLWTVFNISTSTTGLETGETDETLIVGGTYPGKARYLYREPCSSEKNATFSVTLYALSKNLIEYLNITNDDDSQLMLTGKEVDDAAETIVIAKAALSFKVLTPDSDDDKDDDDKDDDDKDDDDKSNDDKDNDDDKDDKENDDKKDDTVTNTPVSEPVSEPVSDADDTSTNSPVGR